MGVLAPDTARVEADDVEPLRQRAVGSFAGAEQGRHGAHARRTRATRVDHERPDLVAGRLEAQHAELGGAALGVRVVERDLQPRAVVALLGEGGPVVRAGERGARPPRERLRIEPPEPRRHGVDARRGRGRAGPTTARRSPRGRARGKPARAVSAAARSRTGAVRRLRRTAPACQRAGPRRRPPLRDPPRVATLPARVGTFAAASRRSDGALAVSPQDRRPRSGRLRSTLHADQKGPRSRPCPTARTSARRTGTASSASPPPRCAPSSPTPRPTPPPSWRRLASVPTRASGSSSTRN